MAAHLTDSQKNAIIIDYVEIGAYSPVAKKYGISVDTVKRVVLKSEDTPKMLQLKKQQNAVDMMEYLETKKGKACEIIDLCMDLLADKNKLKTANPAQLTTAMGTVIDKFVNVNAKSSRGKDDLYRYDPLIIADNYHAVHRDILNQKHSEYVFAGGRGSAKSSFVSSEIIELLKNNPQMHAIALRNVGNTLKDSVYAQIKWAISEQGLDDEFDCKKTPLEIIYKPTKQKIYFRGADDPMKLKSIKTEFGYIGICWFEELDQFSGPAEVRNIEQSVLRGGDNAFVFKSFNPPKTNCNWANKYIKEPKQSMLVHKSTYLDVPKEWLGAHFLDEAEYLKEVNPQAYDNEYMGAANGTGGMVFDNVKIETITDDQIKRFDRVYQGIDFGWYPDPFAFIRLHYDRARETIYIFDEIVQNKLPNAGAAKSIIDLKYDDISVTCDSAEPKSVYDLRDNGLNAKLSIKGPGSVDYSMKWLQVRTIVVDPRRAPCAAEEFANYEYARDKDGEVISGYPDANNHCIDATRYALESFWTKRGSNA